MSDIRIRTPYGALDPRNLPKGVRYEPEHNRIVVTTYDERGTFRVTAHQRKEPTP